MRQPIDLLITAPHIACFDDAATVIDDGAIAITGNTTAWLGKASDAHFTPAETLHGPNTIAMPGLIDCHVHTAQPFLHGKLQAIQCRGELRNPMWQRYLIPFESALTPAPRVIEMVRRGIRLGFGTGGAATRASLDLFQVLQGAVLGQQAVAGTSYHIDLPVTHEHILRLALRGSVAAARLLNTTGSLESGKRADIILVNTTGPDQFQSLTPSSPSLKAPLAAASKPSSSTAGLDRLAVLVNALPIIALGPVLIITVGREGTPTALASIPVFFLIYMAAGSGLRSANHQLQLVFTTLGASSWQRLLRLEATAALPTILAGLKIAAGCAMIGAIVGEWFGAPTGLGIVVLNSMQNFQIPLMWATVLVIAAITLTSYAILGLVERAVRRRIT